MTERYSIPSFLGGISQQSPAIRNANLVEDANNIEFLASEGAQKRYPTKFIADLEGDYSGYQAFTLERDGAEYVLLIGDDDIKAFDLTGFEYIVQGDTSYLSGVEYNDVRGQAIADSMFVLNRNTVVVGAPGKTVASWVQPGEAGVFIKQTNYGVRYTIKFKTAAMPTAKEVSHTIPSSPLDVLRVSYLGGSEPPAEFFPIGAARAAGSAAFSFAPYLFNSVDEFGFIKNGAAGSGAGGTFLSNEDFIADPYTKEIFYQGSTLLATD
ncbi:MAG TPA: hypothetical protein V6D20_21565, partial [Candidatus Obscuribacterales bacterium]